MTIGPRPEPAGSGLIRRQGQPGSLLLRSGVLSDLASAIDAPFPGRLWGPDIEAFPSFGRDGLPRDQILELGSDALVDRAIEGG